MPSDDRDLLEVLKSELDFIEKGGYGRSVRTPWKPTSIFEDSPTCINFGDSRHSRPCEECLLMGFVPADTREQHEPCHHIPLNAAGATVEDLELAGDQSALEEAVKRWLKKNIAEIEQARAQRANFGTASVPYVPPKQGNRKRVLVIDDDEHVLMSLDSLLETAGFDTTVAWGGRAALGLLRETSFDLVLLDDYLPDATSEQILNHVRKALGRTPVVMMQTAGMTDEQAAQLAHLGVFYFSRKWPLGDVAAMAQDHLARTPALASCA